MILQQIGAGRRFAEASLGNFQRNPCGSIPGHAEDALRKRNPDFSRFREKFLRRIAGKSVPPRFQLPDSGKQFRKMTGWMSAPCVTAGLPVVTVPLKMFPCPARGNHPAPVAANEGENLLPESQLFCCIEKVTAPEGSRRGKGAWFIVQKWHQTFPDHGWIRFRMESIQDCQNLIMKRWRFRTGMPVLFESASKELCCFIKQKQMNLLF